MQIDMSQPILDYKGTPIEERNDEIMLLRSAVWIALNSLGPGENPPADEKLRRFRVTQAAFTNDTVDVSLEDAVFIREKSGLANAPLVHGRLVEIFDAAVSSASEAPEMNGQSTADAVEAIKDAAGLAS